MWIRRITLKSSPKAAAFCCIFFERVFYIMYFRAIGIRLICHSRTQNRIEKEHISISLHNQPIIFYGVLLWFNRTRMHMNHWYPYFSSHSRAYWCKRPRLIIVCCRGHRATMVYHWWLRQPSYELILTNEWFMPQCRENWERTSFLFNKCRKTNEINLCCKICFLFATMFKPSTMYISLCFVPHQPWKKDVLSFLAML